MLLINRERRYQGNDEEVHYYFPDLIHKPMRLELMIQCQEKKTSQKAVLTKINHPCATQIEAHVLYAKSFKKMLSKYKLA